MIFISMPLCVCDNNISIISRTEILWLYQVSGCWSAPSHKLIAILSGRQMRILHQQEIIAQKACITYPVILIFMMEHFFLFCLWRAGWQHGTPLLQAQQFWLLLSNAQQLTPLHPRKPEQTCHPVTGAQNRQRDGSGTHKKIPLLTQEGENPLMQ